jgi:hypothetical protein
MKVPFAAAVVSRFGLALLLGSLVASAGASAETEHVIIKNLSRAFFVGPNPGI